MCRFLVYKDREVLMSDLLLKTEQSLIIQSYKAKERKEPLTDKRSDWQTVVRNHLVMLSPELHIQQLAIE